MVARFFGGFFSASVFVLGGGIIKDVILPEYQGKVMAIYSFGALLSPVLGPMTFVHLRCRLIVGEDMSPCTTGEMMVDITDDRWRYIFWGLASIQVVVAIATLLFLPETSATIILDLKTKRLRSEGRTDVVSPMETGHKIRLMKFSRNICFDLSSC